MLRTAKSVASSILLAAALAAAAPATAAVVDATPGGFLVKSEATVAAPPARVWTALTAEIARWWDAAHSWSGDAANLSLDPTPGGCFCEKLPDGGGVRHLTVVYAAPGRLLRLAGALGPLQESGLAGSLTWSLAPAEGGTTLTLSYSVGGYWQGGLQPLAPIVDGVLGEQLGRLERYVETGRPAAE